MVSHEDQSTQPGYEYDYMLEIARAAWKQLEEEGLVHMVGRTSAGEPCYGLTETPPRGTRIRRWILRRFSLTLLFPSFVLEHAAWWTALVLTYFFGGEGVPQLALSLVDLAYELDCWRGLHRWRTCFQPPETVWLSVKPEND